MDPQSMAIKRLKLTCQSRTAIGHVNARIIHSKCMLQSLSSFNIISVLARASKTRQYWLYAYGARTGIRSRTPSRMGKWMKISEQEHINRNGANWGRNVQGKSAFNLLRNTPCPPLVPALLQGHDERSCDPLKTWSGNNMGSSTGTKLSFGARGGMSA